MTFPAFTENSFQIYTWEHNRWCPADGLDEHLQDVADAVSTSDAPCIVWKFEAGRALDWTDHVLGLVLDWVRAGEHDTLDLPDWIRDRCAAAIQDIEEDFGYSPSREDELRKAYQECAL